MKKAKYSKLVLVAGSLFSVSSAHAVWFFLPWLLVAGKVAVVKTVVIGKGAALVIAQQSVTIAPAAKAATIIGKSVVVGTKLVPVAAVGGVLVSGGLVSSGSKEIDETVVKELAAARTKGLSEYNAKVCQNKEGKHYPVPTDALKCLDGSNPELLDKPLKIDKIDVADRKKK